MKNVIKLIHLSNKSLINAKNVNNVRLKGIGSVKGFLVSAYSY